MDPKFRSSFIPKKAITPEDGRPKKHHSAGIVMMVASLLFVSSLIGSIGVYGYEFVLKNRINTKGIELESKRPFIDTKRIEEHKILHNKLRVASNLVNGHISFTLLFDHLEETTLRDVQFKTYTHNLGLDGSLEVELSGITRDYGTLVLQSEAFKGSDVITSADFSDFSLDDFGNVSFSVNALVNSKPITYRNKLNPSSDIF